MKMYDPKARFLLTMLFSAPWLFGCGGDDEESQDTGSNPPPVANAAPTIAGTPPSQVTVGDNYNFAPLAADPDGDTLNFSIANMPSWASFDAAAGQLSGMPDPDDVGMSSDIRISVSDGSLSAALPEFSIEVVAAAPPPGPPPGPPPSAGWPTGIPVPNFDFEQQPGPITQSGGLPATLAAGEVLDFTGFTGNGDRSITCSGTEASPAFILGGVMTTDDDDMSINGSWCIFVGTEFVNTVVRTSGDHHILRDIEQRDSDSHNGTSFGGSNIVVIDSEFHHNQGDDRHGIHVRSGASNIWILRNYIHHNGGDGFQACHGCSANPPGNVYIGQNLFHSDRENAVDLKYINNVVISENVMHSYVSAPEGVLWCFDDGSSCKIFSSGSDGSAIVIGSDGGPSNVQVLNNEIHDSRNAVRIEDGTGVALVDNFSHDIPGSCLSLEKNGPGIVYENNHCLNADRGIFQFWRVNFSLFVENSTFENISGPAIEYETEQVGLDSTLVNNQFIASGPVIYNNVTADTAEEINNLPNASGNSVQ